MNRITSTDIRLMRDRMLDVLGKESAKRHQYADDGWILAERKAMLDAVNIELGKARLPSVMLADIERVERLAVGHSDYGAKFALYCAELACGYRANDIEP